MSEDHGVCTMGLLRALNLGPGGGGGGEGKGEKMSTAASSAAPVGPDLCLLLL